LSVASEVRGGRTSFDAFSGRVTFANDEADLHDVALVGPGVRLSLTGDLSLAEKALEVTVLARQAGSDGSPSAGGSQLSVQAVGYWDDPRLVIDAASLVRRSEAAAPLFAPAAAASGDSATP
jgi:AsmA protein